MRRPLCMVCLLFMAALWAAGALGFSPGWGNPLPTDVRKRLASGPEVQVCGEVESVRETDKAAELILRNTFLTGRSAPISIDRISVTTEKNIKVPLGAVLLLSGNIREINAPRNPGEFDSRSYYNARRIFYRMEDAAVLEISEDYDGTRQGLSDLRVLLSQALEETAGEDASAFSAMLLGDRSGIEEETNLLYRMTGIMHLFSLSSLHISFLGMAVFNLLMALGAGLSPSALASLGLVIPYAVMTGSGFSVTRAVIMFLFAMTGRILGRVYDRATALSAAAVLMLLESPACLYDSGFLLSFGAVLGVTAISPALQTLFLPDKRRPAEKKARWRVWLSDHFQIRKTLLSSLGVQLATLPVTLWFYGEVSLSGLFLNLLILPTAGTVLVSALLSASFGALGIGLFGSVSSVCGALILIGKVCAAPGRLLLKIYDALSRFAAGSPVCTWIAGRPAFEQCILYCLLAALSVVIAGRGAKKIRKKYARKKEKQKRLLLRLRLLVVCLLGLAVFILTFRSSSLLRVCSLDVGQGQGIVIQTPQDRTILVDAGSTSSTGTGKYQLLPYLKNQGISRVDAVFVTHTDQDHISGLEYLLELIADRLTTIRVDRVILPDCSEQTDSQARLQKKAEAAGAQVLTAEKGDVFRLGEASFRVLSPEHGIPGKDLNEESLVLELCYGNFKELFTGDIGAETEEKLLQQGLLEDVDVLQVPHHGSRYSSTAEFLEAVKAETAVISCSATNTYGHPSPETVGRLLDAGCRIEYTMKSGAVTIETDGERFRIRRFLDP